MSYGQGYHPQFAQGSSGYAPQHFQPQPGYHQQFAPQPSAYNPQTVPNPTTYNPQFVPISDDRVATELLPSEVWWRGKYLWLLTQGYTLRDRYNPQWRPSWYDNPNLGGRTLDSQFLLHENTIDAVCTKHGAITQVVLKRVDRFQGSDDPDEVGILGYFSTEDVSSDPRNHTCPLLEVLRDLEDDRKAIIVMPALRPYNSPKFDSVGEALDFIRQMLRDSPSSTITGSPIGELFVPIYVNYIYERCDRDVRSGSIMMNPSGIYNTHFDVWQPKRKADWSGRIRPDHTRTESPPKYYIIDFGRSKRYDEAGMPPSHPPVRGADTTVPELGSQSCDPFPIDVYTVGNLILADFIEGNPLDSTPITHQCFEFLRPLVIPMTAPNPRSRPSMQEALSAFDTIVSQQPGWLLRSQVKSSEKKSFGRRVGAGSAHWGRRLVYITRRLPAVPGTRR
ncbi:hypothetical protein FA13DRAFT_1797966 [Coprinellus micaceus]|uniref:Protein kinase domain-containing protein n=1 Tax=Coprinellus micaceus TaxID=71717 RepID=A0A4Y7SNN0_COPMI|nr:hypothetical protein FA13DRAFT_1797966 [Coprinellus micaceus]